MQSKVPEKQEKPVYKERDDTDPQRETDEQQRLLWEDVFSWFSSSSLFQAFAHPGSSFCPLSPSDNLVSFQQILRFSLCELKWVCNMEPNDPCSEFLISDKILIDVIDM